MGHWGQIMSKHSTILVVDDDQMNITVVTSALKAEYNIISVLSGFEAIDQIKEQLPDLILLDVMMPDMDGFETCKIIRSDKAFADIPIIFLTALDSQEGIRQGLAIGGIDYVTKPLDLELLKLRVHNHLELKNRNDLVKDQRDLLEIKNKELEEVLARVKLLEGIIPICSYCKKIKDDKKNWHQLETYISLHSEAMFSHGMCPECAEEQMQKIKKMVILNS